MPSPSSFSIFAFLLTDVRQHYYLPIHFGCRSVIFNQKSPKHPESQTPFTGPPVVTLIMASRLWVVKHQSSITSGPIILNDIKKHSSVSTSCTISPELKRRANNEPRMLRPLTGTFLVASVNHVSSGLALEQNHVMSFLASQ